MADYGQLKNDAVTEYLRSGGTQANVDAYFRANPQPNYEQLAKDASQWYADPNRAESTITSPDYTAPPETQAGRNANVGNYFGISSATAGGALAAPPITYPAGWEETFKKLAPAVQQAIQSRYGNMTPEQIMQDWQQNVVPQYAQGTSTEDILGGKGIRLPPNLTSNAMTPGNARMSREYAPTGIAGYRDAGDSYYAALKDPNRHSQTPDESTQWGGSGLQSATDANGQVWYWDAKDGFGGNAMKKEDWLAQYQPQQQQQQWDPWGQQQQPQQQPQQQQQQQQYRNPNWYAQGFTPGSTRDPMVVQNAIQAQTNPGSMAGIFKNLNQNYKTLQQQQGGSPAIMSSLDQPPLQGGF